MSRPHKALRSRPRRRPRIRPRGVMECWSVGVLEYCAKSELHPASAGLGMLKGRKIFSSAVHLVNASTPDAPVLPPLQGGAFMNRHLGLKPQAESCSPFGTRSAPFTGDPVLSQQQAIPRPRDTWLRSFSPSGTQSSSPLRTRIRQHLSHFRLHIRGR
jgi:hypothetical protein